MKKIILGAAVALLMSTSLFAKTWTNNIGVGFSVPISSIGVDKDGADDIFQIGYGVQGFYTGFHQNGFTVKASESVGVATSKDIGIQDSDTNVGVFSNLEIGAGYSFIRTEKVTLSALGMFGLDISVYSDSGETTYNGQKADYTDSIGTAIFSAGADLQAIFRFKPNFGMFCNIAGRYLIAGGTFGETEYKYKNTTHTDSHSDGNLRGKFRIQPSIGVVWTF